MITSATFADAVVVALVTMALGLVVGLAYFRALRLTADLFAHGRGRILPLGLTLIRFAGLIAILLLAAKLGAAALIASFVGFLLARTIAVRSASEAG